MNSIIKLVALTLFTLLGTGAWAELDVYKIWGGEYEKVRNKVQNFVAEKDTSRGWSNVYEKTSLLSFVGRHAAISQDVSTLNWAQNQLFEKYREVEKTEIADKNDKRVHLLRIKTIKDILWLMNSEVSLQKKVNLLTNQYREYDGPASLFDDEYVSYCNSKLDVFLEASMYKEAEKTAHACTGNLYLRQSFNANAAFTFMVRIEYIYAILGNYSSWTLTTTAIGKLLSSGNLLPKSPDNLEAMVIYAKARLLKTDWPSVEMILQQFLDTDKNKVFIPKATFKEMAKIWSLTQAYKGIGINEKQVSLSSEDILFYQNLSNAVNGNKIDYAAIEILEEHYPITSELGLYLEIVRLAYQFQKKPNVQEMSNILSDISRSLVTRKVNMVTNLTTESFDTFDNHMMRAILLLLFQDRFEKGLPEELTPEILSIFFEEETFTDFMSQINGNQDWENKLQRSIARNYLNLSRENEAIAQELRIQLVEDAISYSKDYKYREMLSQSAEGSIASDFLTTHRALQEDIIYFNQQTSGKYQETKFASRIDLGRLQSAIGSDQAVIAYTWKQVGTKNFVLTCEIGKTFHQCGVNEIAENFASMKVKVRQDIDQLNRDEFDTAASKALYQAIFAQTDLSKYSEIMIFPPKVDLGLPFNALLNKNNQFLGLTKDISLLYSLIPRVNVPLRAKSKKTYLGIGDVQYGQKKPIIKSASKEDQKDKESGTLGTRSNISGKDFSTLVDLPETRKEITDSSSEIPKNLKHLLFDKEATELNLRFSNLSDFETIHFATHAVSTGELNGISEPGLVLTQPDDVKVSLNDGLLTETEILQLELHNSKIILSACETAADFGNNMHSGIGGLASSFLSAGAKEVLATQWKIESLSAARIIGELNSTGSLREAMLNEFNNNPEPFFWSPFIKFKSLSINQTPNVERSVTTLETLTSNSDQVYEIADTKKINGHTWSLIGAVSKDTQHIEFELKNLETNKKIPLPHYGNFLYFSERNSQIILIGTKREATADLAKYKPVILTIDPLTGKIDTKFEFSSFEEKNGAPSAVTETIADGFSMVVTSYSTDKENNTIANYRLLNLSSDYQVMSNYQLPDEFADFTFLDGYLIRLRKAVKPFVLSSTYDEAYGTWPCDYDTMSYQLDFFNVTTQTFDKFRDFEGFSTALIIQYPPGSNLKNSTILFGRSCNGGGEKYQVYDIRKGHFSEELNLPPGRVSSPRKYIFKNEEYLTIDLGIKARLKRLPEDESFKEGVDFTDPKLIIAPSSLRFAIILKENASGKTNLLHSISGRTETYMSKGYIEEGRLVLPVSIERRSAKVLSFALD